MDFLTALTTTSTSTLLVIGGMLFLLLSFVTLKKPIVVELNAKSRTNASIIGGLMLLAGVALSVFAAQPSEVASTPTPEPTPVAIALAATTEPARDTPSVVPETPTQERPTATPEDEVPGPLSRNCFHSTTWLISTGNTEHPLETNGCWQMSPMGWSALDSGFSVFLTKARAGDTYGIYTSIPPNVQITFDLQINRLYSLGNAAAKVFTGIVDVNEPDRGGFLVFNETFDVSRSAVQVGDNLKFPEDLGRYLQHGNEASIKLVLEGVKLSIYLNGQLLKQQGITIAEPAFWFGNRFNTGGDVDLSVTNFLITEK